MKCKGHLQKIEDGIIAPEQGWIISNKFLYTDDAWKTTKSVFGKYMHNGQERWGILSDAIVGGLIEGTEIEGGSLRIGRRPGYVGDDDGAYALVVRQDGTVQINAWGGELNDKLTEIESAQYDVIIESTTTPILDESVQSTVLTCNVYQNYLIITPPAGTTYTWIRSSTDSAGDATWNNVHRNQASNTITITADDIEYSAQFRCEVNIP